MERHLEVLASMGNIEILGIFNRTNQSNKIEKNTKLKMSLIQ